MWLFLFLFVNPWHSVWFSIFPQAGFGDTLHLAGGEAEPHYKLWEVTAHTQWIQRAAWAVLQFCRCADTFLYARLKSIQYFSQASFLVSY